jgi:hypothetical protein
MGVPADIEGSAGHLSKLRRHLAKPPSATVKLTLAQVGDPPITLGTWKREELVPALAEVIYGHMTEAFNEDDRAESTFVLVFEAEEGPPLATPKWNIRRRALPIDVDGAGHIARMLDGSDKGSTMVAQGAALAVARLFVSAQQQSQEALIKALNIVTERMDAAEERAQRYREERDEAYELAMTAMRRGEGETDGDPVPRELTEAQKKVLELGEKALTLAMIKWGQSGS